MTGNFPIAMEKNTVINYEKQFTVIIFVFSFDELILPNPSFGSP